MTYPASTRLDNLMANAMPGAWDRLRQHGWTIAANDVVLPATAWANPYTQQIVARRRLETAPTARHRWYVLPHEAGHALDFAHDTPSGLLAEVLGINFPSAQEALGEAVAYLNRPSRTMKVWINASINWHCRVKRKWKYSWSHVSHPATLELGRMLIAGPGSGGGQFWIWDQGTVVRVAPPA